MPEPGPTAIRRGIVLAGGAGTRLYPATAAVTKQLLPVHDKPLVYYPLATLLALGIDEVLVIATPRERGRFEALLGDGARLGVRFRYAEQARPGGIAEALRIGEAFAAGEPVALILGDNLFHGDLEPVRQRVRGFGGGAVVFGYPVQRPGRYGVIEVDAAGRPVSIEEKPARPRSRYAVTGLYLYDGSAARRARALQPSARGELEITDLNRSYLDEGALAVHLLERGFAWLDAGTHDSLLEASTFVAVLERRQGTKIGCIEEAALRAGRLDDEGARALLREVPPGAYRDYLRGVIDELHPEP